MLLGGGCCETHHPISDFPGAWRRSRACDVRSDSGSDRWCVLEDEMKDSVDAAGFCFGAMMVMVVVSYVIFVIFSAI